MKSGKAIPEMRRAWEPPTITRLAIGNETKSVGENRRSVAAQTQPATVRPQPPAAPATKLGFSIEWAFPLSARWED